MLRDAVSRRSAGDVVIGVMSRYIYGPAVNPSGTLLIIRSISSLYHRSDDFISFSAPLHNVEMQCNSLALSACEDVVAFALVSKAVALSKCRSNGVA